MPSEYLKIIHVSSVVVSYMLFIMRGWWALQESAKLSQRWVRIVPHLVDTVLLTSAIALAASLGYTPLNSPWLTAKILALVVYIGLGTVAIKRGKTRRVKLLAWLAAQGTFWYIVSVALCHSANPWLCSR